MLGLSRLGRRALSAAGSTFVLAGSPLHAAGPSSVTVRDAWTRPTAAGANGAGYLSITNKGKAADRLIGASSPGAVRVSMHQSVNLGQVMAMRPVAAVLIAPGATVTFKPGGLHLMLEGLKHPEKPGDHLDVVLRFARAGRTAASLSVREAAPSPAMPGMAM